MARVGTVTVVGTDAAQSSSIDFAIAIAGTSTAPVYATISLHKIMTNGTTGDNNVTGGREFAGIHILNNTFNSWRRAAVRLMNCNGVEIIGNTFGPLIFMICVLGGLGNMIGGFVAAFIISLIISIVGYYTNTELSYVLAFAFFIGLMFVRPRGILVR